jgi:hypothetical protein
MQWATAQSAAPAPPSQQSIGHGASQGFGRELGEYALDLYTQMKSVWVDLN